MNRFLVLILILMPLSRVHAQNCTVNNLPCVIDALLDSARTIDNENWRGQVYREAAKSLAASGQTNQAIALIPLIENPDTKAMTIRGIGMEAADLNWSQAQYDVLFQTLKQKADHITHAPSKAIAYTYIAMAQAFAKDNDGAWKTAASMENNALRNKAYAETAEIQAETNQFDPMMKSITFIDDENFQDKAYATVTKILAENKALQPALDAATKINNPYKKSRSLQMVIDGAMDKGDTSP